MLALSDTELLLLCFGAIGFGLFLLMKGGNWLVDAAVFVAHRLGMSKLLIGATIIAFGTSSPEFLVSLDAAIQGYADISVGNVIGSNIGNIMFILAMQVVLVGPLVVAPYAVRRDVLSVVISAFVLTALSFMGVIPRWSGGLMLLGLVVFTLWQVRRQKEMGPTALESHIHTHGQEIDESVSEFRTMGQALTIIVLGLVTLVLGAKILVLGAVVAAKLIGISEAVIGLTIVAVGTSLPELFAGLVAARKGHGDIAIGNILGSNLFNILAILGFTSMVVPLAISPSIQTNIFIMLAVTLAFVAFLWKSGKINRPIAYSALGLYILYTIWLYTGVVG